MRYRLLVLLGGLLSCGSTGEVRAQPGDATSRHGTHQISSKQLDEIRRIESLRNDQPAALAPTSFSMPGSSRGKTVDSEEVLNSLMAKMGRRDRRFHFGQSKTKMNALEVSETLKKAADLVVFELVVEETDSNVPLIDVDGDGTLDRVDAIRYSGPEFANLRLCGPTIVLQRNQKLVINLKNNLQESRQPALDWNEGAEPPAPPEPPAYWMMDAPHDLFTTNLHTHGLHISPGGGHDNSFLDLPPRPAGADAAAAKELYLDYELPRNHLAGTFWYHAHRHGSVAYQLANGMAGALIVVGNSDPNSMDLESIPEIQAANLIKDPTDPSKNVDYGRVLLLQQLVFTQVPGVDADGKSVTRWIVDPADVNDRKSAKNEKNIGRITEGIPPNKPDPAEVLAVNGQNVSPITIQRGQIERWRLIHAGRESALNLAWYRAVDLKDPSNDSPPITDAIEMYEIATDGIPTGRLTKLTNDELYPGYRSDILVRVTPRAADGEYWLLPSEATRLVRTRLGPVKNSTPVARLMVQGQLAMPMNLPSAARLDRLKRRPPDVANAEVLDLNFTFADKERFGVSNVAHGAGKPYAETGSSESIKVTLNKPQIWNLGVREFLPGVPEAVKHPFHIHVNPFYIPALGIWKDTIVISREEVTTVHFLPTDYSGRAVLHCHILDHEDQGMMKDISIVGTSREQYPDLYQMERVADAEQIKINGLDLVQGKHNVLLFITGMGCPHCVDGMVKLWKRADPLKDLDASIKCISMSPFQQKDLVRIGVNRKEHFTFHTCSDDFELKHCDSRAMPAGPQDPEITHGVLIFDKQQRLRYRYLGDTPLSDLDEITYALMELQQPGISPRGRFHRISQSK